MTRFELKQIFDRNEVPTYYYVFGGLGNGDCFGIEETIMGWEIYYSERGKRSVFGRFDSEEQACGALLAEVDRRLRDEQGRELVLI